MTEFDYSNEFPLDPSLVYLNHAAVGPWPRRTQRAVEDFARENTERGARNYTNWLAVEARLREQLRHLLNAPSVDDIALLKNTSEALSVVAYGLRWRPGDNIVAALQEFPSNRIVWQSLAGRGVDVRLADLNSAATPEDALLALVDDHTRLLAVSSVQYASGLRMDLQRLGNFCRDQGILFSIDAIQSVGALPLDVRAVNADFAMADGHKWMLGPEGVAVFYSRSAARDQLELLQYGWHMVEDLGDYDSLDWRPARSARRFECGSANMLGIHALSASLSLLLEVGIDTISRNVLSNTSYLIDKMRMLDAVELMSPLQPERRSGIVTFRCRKADHPALFRALSDAGVVCAHRGGGIRLSPHFYTPAGRLDRAIELVAKLCSS